MFSEPTITERSVAKLLQDGYEVYKINPAYKTKIFKLKPGKWGPMWETFNNYKSANEAEADLIELLKGKKNLQVK